MYITICALQAVEAMRLGNEAAKFVSAAFPSPMELKFERVAQPFMLLHVNRYLAHIYSVKCDGSDVMRPVTGAAQICAMRLELLQGFRTECFSDMAK